MLAGRIGGMGLLVGRVRLLERVSWTTCCSFLGTLDSLVLLILLTLSS